jgi:hypothetical protein
MQAHLDGLGSTNALELETKSPGPTVWRALADAKIGAYTVYPLKAAQCFLGNIKSHPACRIVKHAGQISYIIL